MKTRPSLPDRIAKFAALLATLCTGVSCSEISYYKQAIDGHLEITTKQRPLDSVINHSETSESLRDRLKLVQRILAFAETEMKLPNGGNYSRYADVGRPHVVYNVFATPEFSMKPREWWYPVVGYLPYRGYYSKKNALRLAERVREKGDDVLVGGVDAYSTLGWFRDPVLNTFIDEEEIELVAVICHELAHRKIFISGNANFSEAFAVSVEREAQRRWLNDPVKLSKIRERENQFRSLVFATRDRLKSLYKLKEISDKDRRTKKSVILENMRSKYYRLVRSWGGKDHYKGFFAKGLNNARFSSLATYYDLVPRFEDLLKTCEGDLDLFYQRVQEIAKKGDWTKKSS